MHKKIFVGIVGAILLFALSGCGSNIGDANSTVSLPTSDESSTTHISAVNEENNEVVEMPEPYTYSLPSLEGVEHLLSEGMEIPEGLVASLPPTQIRVGLADGVNVPLVVMGERLTFEGQGPVMLGGEVFVPVLGVFDNVNPVYPFVTTWDEYTVTIRNPHVTVTITEVPGGDATFEHRLTIPFPGFTPVIPTLPAQRIDGEFMLPLRPIAEAIGVELEWVEESGEVHIFIILEGFGMAFQGDDGTMIMLRPPNPFVD